MTLPVNVMVKKGIGFSIECIFSNCYVAPQNYLNTLEHKHIISHSLKILEYILTIVQRSRSRFDLYLLTIPIVKQIFGLTHNIAYIRLPITKA